MNEKSRICSNVGYLLYKADGGVNKSPLYRFIQTLLEILEDYVSPYYCF